jgi:hypothetical protein
MLVQKTVKVQIYPREISSGLVTKSDVKQKPKEAPAIAGSVSSENTRSLVVY